MDTYGPSLDELVATGDHDWTRRSPVGVVVGGLHTPQVMNGETWQPSAAWLMRYGYAPGLWTDAVNR